MEKKTLYTKLIPTELKEVKPVSQPLGILFYFDFVYEDNRKKLGGKENIHNCLPFLKKNT